jgi:hypothetical protein
VSVFAMSIICSIQLMTQSSPHNGLQVLPKAMPSLANLDFHKGVCRRNTQHLHTLTQLSNLSLHDSDITGVGALAQLIGLTNLSLLEVPGYNSHEPLPAAGQAELGRALSALSNLQRLYIIHAPPGPVTDALSQLTALTQLVFERQGLVPDPGPLVLPSCVRLSFLHGMPMRHLTGIDAPQLQQLDGNFSVQRSDLGSLRKVCRGVLQACDDLKLAVEDAQAWSEEDTVTLMTALSQDWQPSAEALQPLLSICTRCQQSSCSGCPRYCSLDLMDANLSCQCLSLLPKGLAELSLMYVAAPCPKSVKG